MDIQNMSKSDLLLKCNELGIAKCKSKNKKELIELINLKNETQNSDNMDDNTNEENKIIDNEEPKLEITTDNYNVINGDCLVEMKKIKDKSIDMILCDLPYGMTKNSWDVIIPFEKLWCEYGRIIKDNGAIVLFGSQPFTSLMITSNLNMFRYCLVWEKNKFSDFLNSKRKPMKTNENQ